MAGESTKADKVPFSYLTLFTLLYALQGIAIAYFFNFSYGYMAAAGIDNETIAAIQSIALIPMLIKFTLGPISDRFNMFGLGFRRPYIVVGLAVQALGFLGLSWFNPAHSLTLHAAALFVMALGVAFYDTCCDGMMIDTTPPSDRTRVQGIVMCARFIAAMISSLLFGLWLAQTGAGPGKGDGVLYACAALSIIPFVLVLVLAEKPRGADAEQFSWKALKVLVRPNALILLAFGALGSTIAYGVEVNLSAYYASPGLDMDAGAVGVFGALRYIGRGLGAVLVPLVALRMRRSWMVALSTLLLMVTSAGQIWVADSATAGVWALAFGIAAGWYDVLFCTLAMEAAHPRMAASTYALLMAVSNVSLIGGWLFAAGVGSVGAFSPVFLIFAAMMLPAMLMNVPLGRSLAPDEKSGG